MQKEPKPHAGCVGTANTSSQWAEDRAMLTGMQMVPLAVGAVLYSDSQVALEQAEAAADSEQRGLTKWQLRAQYRSIVASLVEIRGAGKRLRHQTKQGAAQGRSHRRASGLGPYRQPWPPHLEVPVCMDEQAAGQVGVAA